MDIRLIDFFSQFDTKQYRKRAAHWLLFLFINAQLQQDYNNEKDSTRFISHFKFWGFSSSFGARIHVHVF
ncbi:hypothetical protein VS_1471 [Vibrio atlanticus]|uniref:Uncharacterized protein n=1 Tax=Vibrio atlanticus (strain LGP32) TaxID=575788 RepID=B7VNQ8_VIBA3|nr:hypothetical protein VS_1471 [Vibrio atlanticus]